MACDCLVVCISRFNASYTVLFFLLHSLSLVREANECLKYYRSSYLKTCSVYKRLCNFGPMYAVCAFDAR